MYRHRGGMKLEKLEQFAKLRRIARVMRTY
jgi:hypothetical protein